MWLIRIYSLLPEPVQASLASIEAGMDNGVFVDFKRRDSHYECITVMAVRNVIDKVSRQLFEIMIGFINVIGPIGFFWDQELKQVFFFF